MKSDDGGDDGDEGSDDMTDWIVSKNIHKACL